MKGEDDNWINGAEGDQSGSTNAPIMPCYCVDVTEAVKNGDTMTFTLMAKRVEEERGTVVTRQFDDIIYLHHQLTTQNNINGVIIPPLPNNPDLDAKAAESKAKKHLGSDTKVLKADDFQLECESIERYLRLLLNHPVFGQDKVFEKFLLEKEAPVRARVKKGLLNWLSSTVDEARKGGHKDVEEYFHKKREWSVDFSKAMKDASNNFIKMTAAQYRVTTSYTHLSVALEWMSPNKDEATVKVNRIFKFLGEGLQGEKEALETLCTHFEKTLGVELDLYARYSDSVKEMLFRRTSLLVDFEDAAKALEKAKPPKKPAAEETKNKTEKAFEECSHMAKKELKSLLHQRVLAMQGGIVGFAETQIKTARDNYTGLVKCLSAIKKLDL